MAQPPTVHANGAAQAIDHGLELLIGAIHVFRARLTSLKCFKKIRACLCSSTRALEDGSTKEMNHANNI